MLSAAGIRRKDEIPKEVFFSKDYDFDAPNLPMKDSELEAADRLYLWTTHPLSRV